MYILVNDIGQIIHIERRDIDPYLLFTKEIADQLIEVPNDDTITPGMYYDTKSLTYFTDYIGGTEV